MSKFSGKCDLYDMVEMIHCDGDEKKVQEFIDNAEFYMCVHGRDVKLDIQDRKDLALYYPYIVSMACHSNGHHYICLSSDSFIDQEEQERIRYCFEDALKNFKRCKKNKVIYSLDNFLRAYGKNYFPEYEKEIIRRVAKDGKKATTEGIHSCFHEHYRREWYNELVTIGWTEEAAFKWVYKTLFTTEEYRNKRFAETE